MCYSILFPSAPWLKLLPPLLITLFLPLPPSLCTFLSHFFPTTPSSLLSPSSSSLLWALFFSVYYNPTLPSFDLFSFPYFAASYTFPSHFLRFSFLFFHFLSSLCTLSFVTSSLPPYAFAPHLFPLSHFLIHLSFIFFFFANLGQFFAPSGVTTSLWADIFPFLRLLGQTRNNLSLSVCFKSAIYKQVWKFPGDFSAQARDD